MLPRFHASYSIGTVAGALVGAILVVLRVSVTVDLVAVGVAIAVGVPRASSGLVAAPASAGASTPPTHRQLAAWAEPGTLVIGLTVFCWSFIEGTATDWIGVSVIDGYHVRASVGSFALGIFLMAFTLGRWFGSTAVDRFGRVTSLRGSALLASVGVLVTVYAGWLPLALLGVIMWDTGGALGMPIGTSAAADDPLLAAGRVGVVTSMGWLAFLAGPPVVGALGAHRNIARFAHRCLSCGRRPYALERCKA
jgi:predicted MFS family arabinose efflux permease